MIELKLSPNSGDLRMLWRNAVAVGRAALHGRKRWNQATGALSRDR